ncbi:MAG: 30S ribosomal protein S2 [Armatimonadetes bacterium]|nr:30S ribosomal protein S2 [Armatimonadota bacterium]
MALVTMKELLEAGVHFGHQTRRWNPKMKPFIYHERNGIYIIDLHATLRLVEAAHEFVRGVAAEGGTVLFVGTKRQGQESIREAAERCGMPYVTHRWLGGMLTNFQTIHKRIEYLQELTKAEERGEWDRLPKKEVLRLRREREKLENSLGGIKEMNKPPDAMFVVDTRREETAVREANILGIPVVAVVDTNSDPEVIDYPIPGNDDAIRAIRLFAEMVASAIIEGRNEYQQRLIEEAETPEEAAAIALEVGMELPSEEPSEEEEPEEEFEGAVEDQFIEEQLIELNVPEEDEVV